MAHRRAGRQPRAAVRSAPAAWRRSAALVLGATALLSIALSVASRVYAGPVEGIAGWEGDGFGQGYGFLTWGALVGEGGRLSVPVRISGSYLYYDYRDDGGTVLVRAPGAAGSLGLRVATRRGTITALAGGELRWERREREATSGPSAAVARGGFVAQGEGDLSLTRRLRPFLLVNYSGSSRYLYGRAVLRWQCSNLAWNGPTTWFVGVEGVGQGNADTDAAQAGGVVECTFARQRISVALRGGYKNGASDSGRREGGYVGVGLYRRF